jgi:pyrophosphate--fructose-6-phosphate 1-phosphotransferase
MSNSFEMQRRSFSLRVPQLLHDCVNTTFQSERIVPVNHDISKYFQHHCPTEVLKIRSLKNHSTKSHRVGVVLSGGPAPGGHNVIAGLFDALQQHPNNVLIGFLDGAKGLLHNKSKVITKADIDAVRNTGGFCLLGTGRSKIATQNELASALQTIQEQKLDALVFIGGDDSNTDAALLSEYVVQKNVPTAIIGVPKTIDGDLQSADIAISFGFDTACKTYVSTISNIAKDAISSKKYYYFIRLMGRIASHVTLECALQVQPNLAIISEEALFQKKTLKSLVSEIADLVEQRFSLHKKYGLILVPEGLIEYLEDVQQLVQELDFCMKSLSNEETKKVDGLSRGEKLDFILTLLSDGPRECLTTLPREIAEELVYDRDPHGNVQVSRIETDRLLAILVEEELKKRESSVPFSYQTHFCGYEGRSAYPSFFDCHYCYALGKTAAILSMHNMNGYMAAVRGLDRQVDTWEPIAVPLVSLMHIETRAGISQPVVQKTLVDLSGPLFARFAACRDVWKLEDRYQYQGPMQFDMTQEIVESPCISIALS